MKSSIQKNQKNRSIQKNRTIQKERTIMHAILNRIFYISFCFFLSIFFITPNAYAEPKITTPDIQLVNINIEKLTFTSMDVNIELDIYNPNDLTLTVSSLAYSLKVNDTLILSDKIQRKEIFHAKKSRHIFISASLPYDDNFASILKLLYQNANVNYSVLGNIQLDEQIEPFSFLHHGFINPSTYIKKLNQK